MLYIAGAVWQGSKGQGRVFVLGSVTVFEDAWLDKEDNSKLLDFVLLWLTYQTSLEVTLLSWLAILGNSSVLLYMIVQSYLQVDLSISYLSKSHNVFVVNVPKGKSENTQRCP